MTRYAVSRISDDRWPIYFRPDCERTYPTVPYPYGQGLLDLIEELDKCGYDLLDKLPKINK